MHSIFSEETLYIFVSVTRHQNFSKAAEELGLTPSAVSYAIKRIEAYLETKLFIRTTKSIELTEAGIYFYNKAESLINEFVSIKKKISTIEQGVESKLRICINSLLFQPKHTATLIHYIKNHFPSCQINISTEVYNGVWDAIVSNRADIAIGAPGILIDGGGIDYTEIGHIHWEFAIPTNHPLTTSPEPIKESLLRNYPTILVEDSASSIHKKVGWLLRGQEAICVPDFDIKLQCQILGDGIGFLPDYYIRDYIQQGILIKKEIQNPRQKSKMLLAYQHHVNGKVTNWIKSEFQHGGLLNKLYSDLLHNH
ncbi:LysR family transcriptional regulator [Pasteurella testudinis]|uniref:LysR family transcriptional regulator n=1 Tax=Pasteurella testudinis TaxID=761 RepID=UPI004057E76A